MTGVVKAVVVLGEMVVVGGAGVGRGALQLHLEGLVMLVAVVVWLMQATVCRVVGLKKEVVGLVMVEAGALVLLEGPEGEEVMMLAAGMRGEAGVEADTLVR